MWVLCGLDGIFPFGELTYLAGILLLGAYALIVDSTTPQVSHAEASVYLEKEHTKGARNSTRQRHEDGQRRKLKDHRGEKGDRNRHYYGNKRRYMLLLFDGLLDEEYGGDVGRSATLRTSHSFMHPGNRLFAMIAIY